MDLCVVITFPEKECADSVKRAARPQDCVCTYDNTSTRYGFAAASNAAARLGRDELVMFLNPDGALAPEALDEIERVFGDPDVVAAECSQGETWDRPPDNEDGDMAWLSGGCFAVRRRLFEMLGGFDERLFMYCEDVDLSYKLQRYGKLRHVPTARFDHPGGGRSFKALHRNYRNWLVVHRRHRKADPVRMVRDGMYSLRRRRWRDGLARLTGTLDYLVRARRWA